MEFACEQDGVFIGVAANPERVLARAAMREAWARLAARVPRVLVEWRFFLGSLASEQVVPALYCSST